MRSRLLFCVGTGLVILTVLFGAGCVTQPDELPDSSAYLWNLSEISCISLPQDDSPSAAVLKSSLVIDVLETSRLLAGKAGGRQAVGMVFDKNGSLFQMDLSSDSSRRVLMGSFAGNESTVIDLSYHVADHYISAIQLTTAGAVPKIYPNITGMRSVASTRQIGPDGEEPLRGPALHISRQTGPLFSGVLDIDIAGAIVPHAFVGGIYAVSGPTASAFVVMEDGEFWDVEIAGDLISFWTVGVSESAAGTEIVSAIRTYGNSSDSGSLPDISGFWSASKEDTISATGLQTEKSGPLTLELNRISGELFSGSGIGGKVDVSGSVVFGTRIGNDVHLCRGWVEEDVIHAARIYAEDGMKYAAIADYARTSLA